MHTYIHDRLKSKIKLTPKVTAVLTGHGMTKAYLHRFDLSEDAKCKCGNEYQSMDHIIFQCVELNDQRELLKRKMGEWPASKEDLITKHKKEFYVFIESIDFEDLNYEIIVNSEGRHVVLPGGVENAQ